MLAIGIKPACIAKKLKCSRAYISSVKIRAERKAKFAPKTPRNKLPKADDLDDENLYKEADWADILIVAKSVLDRDDVTVTKKMNILNRLFH